METLLRAIDFNYSAVSGGGFLHANVVAVMTPDHQVSGFVHGIAYEEEELRRALLSAVTPASLVETFKPLIAVVAVLALLVTLIVLWGTQRRNTPAQAS